MNRHVTSRLFNMKDSQRYSKKIKIRDKWQLIIGIINARTEIKQDRHRAKVIKQTMRNTLQH